MIVLDTTTRSLQIVLAGAKNTNDAVFVATYVDEPITSTSAKSAASTNPGTTNGVTAATIVSAPGLAPGWRRRLVSFNLNNADLAAITVSILYNDNTVTYALFKITLQTLEQLVYEEGFGFRAYDSGGAEKSQAAATSSATSTADSKAVSVSATASTNLSAATVSFSAGASTALSSAVSLSTVASTNLSTFSTASTTTSSQLSLQTSAGTSTTLSKTKSSFGF